MGWLLSEIHFLFVFTKICSPASVFLAKGFRTLFLQAQVSAGALQSAPGSPKPKGGNAGRDISSAGWGAKVWAFPKGWGAVKSKAPTGAPRSPAQTKQATRRDRPWDLTNAVGVLLQYSYFQQTWRYQPRSQLTMISSITLPSPAKACPGERPLSAQALWRVQMSKQILETFLFFFPTGEKRCNIKSV